MDGGTIQLALLVILNAVIAGLVSSLTALGVSYFRTRGQNLATKHDFEELQKQLKANTELVETIKSEVSQRDWAQREWTNLRRVKLEALLVGGIPPVPFEPYYERVLLDDMHGALSNVVLGFLQVPL
jgi:hypothetical protein